MKIRRRTWVLAGLVVCVLVAVAWWLLHVPPTIKFRGVSGLVPGQEGFAFSIACDRESGGGLRGAFTVVGKPIWRVQTDAGFMTEAEIEEELRRGFLLDEGHIIEIHPSEPRRHYVDLERPRLRIFDWEYDQRTEFIVVQPDGMSKPTVPFQVGVRMSHEPFRPFAYWINLLDKWVPLSVPVPTEVVVWSETITP